MKVLKIGGQNCEGCKTMKPRWQEIESENSWLETEYIEGPDRPEIVEKYKIESLPVFIFLDKEGNEIQRFTGVVEKEVLLKALSENKGR